MALATVSLSKIIQKSGSTNTFNSNSTKPKGKGIEEWQLKNVGASILHHIKHWWWCEHHCQEKGCYVRHPPDQNEEWVTHKKTGVRKAFIPKDTGIYKSTANTTPDSNANANPAGSAPGTLALSRERKTVLDTFNLPDSDAEQVWTQASERASKD